jgi:hypothetical protein
VKADSELPLSFRDALAAQHLGPTQPFPYMVLMPTFEGILTHPENEKLVFLSEDRVYVLESVVGGISTVCYSPNDIFYIERGTILLYSWITIQGRSLHGPPSCSILKFNTVTEDVMSPITDRLRSWSKDNTPGESAAYPSGLGGLGRLNLKFQAYAEASLRPGDSVAHWIYEPQRHRGPGRLMGLNLTRSIAPAHLVMLTRRELILICDDDTQRPPNGDPYGAICTYIPLSRIVSASMQMAGSGVLALQIHLAPSLHIEVRFEPSRKEAVKELLSTLAAPGPSIPAVADLP